MDIQIFSNSYLLNIKINEKKEIINLCLENDGGYYIMYRNNTFYEGSAQGDSILNDKDAAVTFLINEIVKMNLSKVESEQLSVLLYNGFALS